MRRWLYTLIALTFLGSLLGYVSGLFTQDIQQEEACALCRAVRHIGHHYGIGYETVEEGALTEWYRKNIDARHGQGTGHPHQWQRSGYTLRTKSGVPRLEETCDEVAPLFLLRPEIQLAVLEQIPDREAQVTFLRSLNASDRRDSVRRIRLLIEYYYIEKREIAWESWWRMHASDFGVTNVK